MDEAFVLCSVVPSSASEVEAMCKFSEWHKDSAQALGSQSAKETYRSNLEGWYPSGIGEKSQFLENLVNLPLQQW